MVATRNRNYGPVAFHAARRYGARPFQAVRMRFRNRGGGSRTQTRRNSNTSGRGVTQQYDRKTIYRKKRMPYRKRKRWSGFVKKVHAASEKDLGSKTIVFNSQLAPTDPGDQAHNRQINTAISLYNLETDVTKIATNDSNISSTGKFIFKSGVLDVTYRNLSQEEGGAGMSVELDVYEITAKRNFMAVTGNKDLIQAFVDGFSDTDTITLPTAGTSLNLHDRGVTPWDCPQSLSQWKMTIAKKTKYFLGFGQTMTYQIRDPSRHVFDKEYVITTTGTNAPGKTRYVLFVQKVVPGAATGAGYNNGAAIGVTRKYLYKHNEDSRDADQLNP